MLKRRAWHRLGFSRLTDYTGERLGLSARSLEEDARVIMALVALPAILQAFEARTITWTHARLLAGVATAESEKAWLELALTSTTRKLAELMKGMRRGALPPGYTADPDACASQSDSASAASRPDAFASAEDAARTGPFDPDADDPLVSFNITVTYKGRQLWHVLRDLASRMCGVDVSAARVLEVVAAEAMSWSAWEAPTAEPMPKRALREKAEAPVRAFEALRGTAEGFDWVERPRALQTTDAALESLLADLDSADAHELDGRLRAVRLVAQGIDGELGAFLRRISDGRYHQYLGFADIRLYAEARLGICGSKALALIRLDRECSRNAPTLLQAYREGRVGWLAATELLQVICRGHEDAWVKRAESVTLRRLEADVRWVLVRADETGSRARQPPPPLELDVIADALASIDPADVQMRAHREADPDANSRRVDAKISLAIPTSTALLLEDAIEGCRNWLEPRWRAFERILAHAYLTWMSLPQHESPIFTRDNHRCTTPACRRRAPLHRHHIWYRSTGGGDLDFNLTAVCDDHHIACIHNGYIRVAGTAPDGIIWEIGCRPGEEPLMRLCGDVYLKK